MKVLKYFTMLSAAVAMMTACELEPKDLFSTDPVAPILTSHNAILLNSAADKEDVTFAWSAARNIDGTIRYTVDASYGDKTATLGSTEGLFITMAKSELRSILYSIGAPDHENFSFSVQVTAAAGSAVLPSEVLSVTAYINAADSAPVLAIDDTDIVLTMGNAQNQFNIAWSASAIGANEAVTYSVFASVSGTDNWTALAEGLTETGYSLAYSDLNTVLLSIGLEPEQAGSVDFKVVAYSESYPGGLASELFTVKVTPYTALKTAVAGWSLIGVNGDWDKDIELVFVDNGLWISPVTAIDGEFKLRFAHGWDVNRGGNGLAEGATVAAEANGANFSLAGGNYYIVYNEVDDTVSAYADTKGWGMIGDALSKGWDGDTYKLLEVAPGVYKSGEVFFGNGGFKFRKDADWGVNFGGDFGTYGVAFTAYPDGSNISLGASNIYAYTTLDTNNNTITVDDSASVLKGGWSVTGEINGTHWDSDVRMYETGNVWRSIPFQYDTHEWGFKIRKDGEWNESYGGWFEEFGKPFGVTGDNCAPESLTGKYIYVVYDPAAATLTVYEVK